MSDFDGEAEFIESVARELRAPVVLTSGLDERVMSEVRRAPHRAPRRLWLLRPVTLRVSPLGGLLAAAGIAAVTVLGMTALGGPGRSGAPDAPPNVAATPARDLPLVRNVSEVPTQEVRFVFVAPGASDVSIVGEFNDWDTDATPLARVDERGVWTVTLPLRPGRYLYMFVVDGTEWAPDPAAPTAPDDGFGVPNSVVTVGGPSV